MMLSVFGSSTCLIKIILNGHSVDKLCHFLGLVPPPSLVETRITSDDWRALINGDYIESDGFYDENKKPVPFSKVSQSCLHILQSISSSNMWKKSPIQAVYALVQLRNMSPWYEKSNGFAQIGNYTYYIRNRLL